MPKYYPPLSALALPMKPFLVPMMPMTPHLELPRRRFAPLRPDRVQRFGVGDHVRVARGGFASDPREVVAVEADPHPIAYAHCSGHSARYRLDGIDGWVYDWMLDSVSRPAADPKDVPPVCWWLLAIAAFTAFWIVRFLFASW